MQRIIIIVLIFATIILSGSLAIILIANKDYFFNKSILSTAQLKPDNQIFSAKSATIEGQIIKIGEKSITVESKNKVISDFALSSDFTINKFTENPPKTINSSNIQDLELNKNSLIFLNEKDGVYSITTITYIPDALESTIPLPPQPQTGSKSAVTTPKPQATK